MELLRKRQRRGVAIAGLLLIIAGSLPSAFGWRAPTLDELSQLILGTIPSTFTPSHLTLLEGLAVIIGAGLLAWAARPLWKALEPHARMTIMLLCAFVVPYFITWFWSYSYHFRLSFAIVPLLIVMFAAIVSPWLDLSLSRTVINRRFRIAAISTIILALSLPGWLATLNALEPALTGSLPTDRARMARGNKALMGLVDYLMDRRDPNRRPLKLDQPFRVEAPGELRLPFFFPLDDIRTERYPIFLDQIGDVDYFVDSSVGQRLYIEKGRFYNQILSSLTRDPVMQRLYTTDDNNFRFSVYYVDKSARFKAPKPNGPLDVQIGDFAWLNGYDLSRSDNFPGESIYLTLWWTALKPADLDYSVYIHLLDPNTGEAVGMWGAEPVSGAFSVWNRVPGAHFDVPYHTRLWQPGETIKDEWKFRVPNAPAGIYQLKIGLYDSVGGQRLPVIQRGRPIGDGVYLPPFTILPH